VTDSISGMFWYWGLGFMRRFRENLVVYFSIASAAFLVFILVGLKDTARREVQGSFVVIDNTQYLEYATTWLMVFGIIIAFLQTQFLLQRMIDDRYVEFGFLINVGTPRSVVGLLISFEQVTHSIVGGFIGILVGLATLSVASLTSFYIPPTFRSLIFAVICALLIPLLAVLPIALILHIRLLRNSRGISRVR
jgi:hypothetical protein